jgi:hypothetical protein
MLKAVDILVRLAIENALYIFPISSRLCKLLHAYVSEISELF